MAKVTKEELVKDVAQKAGISIADARKAVTAAFESITDSLASGNDVSVIGFGQFHTKVVDARKGRNPQTGAEIDIAEHVVARFKPGKGLKDAVNK